MPNSQTRSATKARSELLSRRTELARSSQHNEREGQELRQHNESRERASSEEIAEVLVSLSENERREVQAIDAAIVRIDHGTWGKCAECGGKISVKRLEAMPEAIACLECQSAADPKRS